MQKIAPFLWFENQAEEAMNFYVSIFENSKVLDVSYSGENVVSVTFQLEDQQFRGYNAGPEFKFNEAISFFVSCKTQEEVDKLWEKLSGGGQPGHCGWLKDKFGLWWQIIPTALGEMLSDPDPIKSKKALDAMLQMSKIDIRALARAANS